MPKIGYLLRTFPQLSQTFVNNEIEELIQQQGMVPPVAALYRPGEGIHASLSALASRTLYWFDIDKSKWTAILRANVRLALKYPYAYFRLLKTHGAAPGIFLKKVFLANFFHAAKVCHIHTHFAWEQVAYLRFIKALTGIPFSVTLHAADIYSEPHDLAHVADQAAFLTTISAYNKQYLIHEKGLPPEKIHVVHCGVKPEDFSPLPVSKKNKTLPVILSIGRMTEKKSFDVFIKALDIMLKNKFEFQARIIGDGPLMPDIKKQILAAGLESKVDLAGSLPHAAVAAEIAQCDFFVLACRRAANGDIDGIPVVLMEAMAAAKPVISTTLSGIPELIRPGAGLRVPPENPVQLAKAMEFYLTKTDTANKMGRQGREIVEQAFTINEQVKGLLFLIQKHQSSQ